MGARHRFACAVACAALGAGCSPPSFWVPLGNPLQSFDATGFDGTLDGYVVVGVDQAGATHDLSRLIRFAPSGRVGWSRTVDPDPWLEQDLRIRALPTGGYALCGRAVAGFPSHDTALFLAEVDSDGALVWTTRFTPVSDEDRRCASVHVLADGGLAAFYWFDSGDPEARLLRTDAAGTELWTVELPPDQGDLLVGISTRDDGFAYAMATVPDDPQPSPADRDPALVKLDASGQEVWQRHYPRDLLDELPRSLQQTSDGGYLLSGEERVYYPDQNDQVWVRKTDAAGSEEWVADIANDVRSEGGSAVEDPSGGYVVRAERSEPPDQRFTELGKLDETGGLESVVLLGAPSCMVQGRGLAATPDAGFVFTARRVFAYLYPQYLIKSGPGTTGPAPPADCV